jgi:hypothetical protein
MNPRRAAPSPRTLLLLLTVLASASTTGCIQTWRVHPEARSWVPKVRTVAVLSAIRIDEVSAGNVREEHDEWSAQGNAVVLEALRKGLEGRGLEVRALKTARGDAELEEVQSLYALVSRSAFVFAYPPYPNEHKMKHFEYSVGPLDKVLDRVGADALLIAYARDGIATTGRRLTAVFAGLQEPTMLTVGLLDRQGRLVWFDLAGGHSYDLRERADVEQIVAGLMEHLGSVK